jgi:hypothetical protein
VWRICKRVGEPMLDFVYVLISMCLIFLLGSVFGERDAKYGFILIPLLGLAFWSFGWLSDIYVVSILPLVLGLAIITFMREQLRDKFAGSGSASSLIWKIMAFMLFLQFALIFVNGIVSFQAGGITMETANNTYTQNYNLETANATYGGYTDDLSSIDQITVGFKLVWMAWGLTWQMLWGIITIYPNLITIFHMPPMVAWVISAGFYVMIGLEVFVLFMFRTRPPEI